MITELEREIYNLSNAEIVKITPYLDNIEPKLTIKQRKFAIFYALKEENGAEACRKSGYKVRKGKDEPLAMAVQASQNLNKLNIKEALIKIRKHLIDDKSYLEKKLYDMWKLQATYDPSVFYNPDGKIKFKKWEDIPEKYRCLITKFEVKYYGRDANREVIVMELADKKFAQDKLDKYIQMTKETIDLNEDIKININLIKELEEENETKL